MIFEIWIIKLVDAIFLLRSVATFLLVLFHGKGHWLGASQLNTAGSVRSHA